MSLGLWTVTRTFEYVTLESFTVEGLFLVFSDITRAKNKINERQMQPYLWTTNYTDTSWTNQKQKSAFLQISVFFFLPKNILHITVTKLLQELQKTVVFYFL